VSVDDCEPVTVHAENPWLLLPAGIHHMVQDELLTEFATRPGHRTEAVRLPLALEPGEEAWLDVDLPSSPDGYLVRLDATQVRVTGWAGGECVGRVRVGDRPAFSGEAPTG
jgi:hypothetical protein